MDLAFAMPIGSSAHAAAAVSSSPVKPPMPAYLFRPFKLLPGFAVLLFAASSVLAGQPSLRRSEATIRKQLLAEVPLGSAMTRVEQQIARHQWKVSYKDLDSGFLDQRTNPYKVTGAKSIRASLGDYRGFPFMVNVTVFWGFDENGSLIDVWVWKTWDSI